LKLIGKFFPLFSPRLFILEGQKNRKTEIKKDKKEKVAERKEDRE
jgi:hypothetical protein